MIELATPAFWLPPKPAIIRSAEFKRADRIAALVEGMAWVPGMKYPRPGATRTYVGTATVTGNATSFTFNSQALGTPSGTSLVVVIAHVFSTGINGTVITAVNIDGSAGSIIQNATSLLAGGGGSLTAIASRVTSNTTGNCSVTVNNSCFGCTIHVYRINFLASTTAYNSNNVQSSASNATSASTTVNIPSGGVLIAGCSWYGHEQAPTFTAGVTQDHSAMLLAGTASSSAAGSNQGLAAQTGRTITATDLAGWASLVMASWQ